MTIKICGITRDEDAQAAVALGVHALGFVLWAKSPRAVSTTNVRRIVDSLPPFVTPVGVFVDPTGDEIAMASRECGIRVAQVHGQVPANGRSGVAILPAVHLSRDGHGFEPPMAGRSAVLVDSFDPVTRGGTGRALEWDRVAPIAARRPVVLAGGLTPENVAEAIRVVRPYGVDVSSGVERAPGVKDHDRLAAFVAAVRAAG